MVSGVPEYQLTLTIGMMLKLEVEDRGPYVALTQGGKVLTQGGKAVVVRKFG